MCAILLVCRDLSLVLLCDCFCHGKPDAVTARELSGFIGAVEADQTSE